MFLTFIMKKNNKESKYLSFREIRELNEKLPPRKMLWNGVKENSCGIVFGPAKSGKSIFCENMAFAHATGKSQYFDYKLDGVPKKVLFIGLEEDWRDRVDRNTSQIKALSEEEEDLINDNYLVQPIEFSKFIKSDDEWNKVKESINDSKASIVYIDSITRMNHGKLEDGKTAEEIMTRLRDLAYEMEITLFAVHHTPKLGNNILTLDSIKGSSVFAQESDFAIGINRSTKGHRYMKNVFFRYASDNDEFVKEFEINDFSLLNLLKEVNEEEILNRSDRRRTLDKRLAIKTYFDSQPEIIYSTVEAIKSVKELVEVEVRQAKTYLSEMSTSGLIDGSVRGQYRSINHTYQKGGGSNG